MLFTGGLALGLLALLHWRCNECGYRRAAGPALAFGVNVSAVFFFSAILSRTFALAQLPGPGGPQGMAL